MNKIFKTDSLGLFGYLVINGLEYIDKEVVQSGKNIKIYFIFKDEAEIGEKLSLTFHQSQIKQYRDLTIFARTEIEIAKNSFFKR